MRTSRSKIRHLTYKKYENITLYYFQSTTWKKPEVKETLVKKANTKNAVFNIPVLIFCIALLLVLAVLSVIFLIRLK
ncbi:hypothetical protein SAMN04488055_3489 [Chitinophaga niabensis]|uniref:Uncharacterized protein n=1 Tax=Chitinophaga niabensis TaxID=536979 RepID=A0A1N6IZM2_9BACT|nr:hypothetical protein SAMN04488055_3489 [Chitinophaga niabensis]